LSFLLEDARGQEASDLIARTLSNTSPCLISRIGSNELGAMATHRSILRRNRPVGKLGQRWFRWLHKSFWGLSWNDDLRQRMAVQAGFFPVTDEALHRFAELSIQCARQIDIYASWRHEEDYLKDLFRGSTVLPLNDLAPFLHEHPWTSALAGRRVLVVHPFSTSIQNNYCTRREKIWQNPEVLPEFDLKTIQAIQTSAGGISKHADWFECLAAMKREMDEVDYEIAIIGAGAYALPLAAHAKACGKKAVNLGAFTQLLFGIWGKRWDSDPGMLPLRNEWWTSPQPEEKPPQASAVEDGCYW